MDELIALVKKLESSGINNTPTTGGLVKLNVGGTVFQTTKSTLTRFDGFFRTLLETDIPVAKDTYGCIFVDRDPKHFRLILNFMRDGDVNIPYSDHQEIRKEAQFYLLDDLMKLCDDAKPVEKQIKNICLKSFEEVANAVNISTKKGVIVIHRYVNDGMNMEYIQTAALIKYGEAFDVLFHTCDGNRPLYANDCNVFNKISKQNSRCLVGELDSKMKKLFGAET
uniref:BTB domain-containing protein n=1 Tax=Caenorhabditis tropicalis TaxID=1561998 RepID=A0A1I7TCK3_9PELO